MIAYISMEVLRNIYNSYYFYIQKDLNMPKDMEII